MTFIQDSPEAAAEAARKEAEAAHVTPGAVMYSAPEGYGTGAGEQFAPVQVDPDDDLNDSAVIGPVAETLQTGEVERFEARTFGDQEGRMGDLSEDAYEKPDTSATAKATSAAKAGPADKADDSAVTKKGAAEDSPSTEGKTPRRARERDDS